MAGSDESGEDMEAGRTNRAENRTRLWAQRNKGESFDGEAIFIVESAGDIEDDDFSQVAPNQTVHGIMSSGCGDGAGVVAFRKVDLPGFPGIDLTTADLELAKGRGVFGKGITGVVGQGDSIDSLPIPGSRSDSDFPLKGPNDRPAGHGAGVVGWGAKGKAVGTIGVAGFAGGVSVEFRTFETGVYGQGAVGVMGFGTNGSGVEGYGSSLAPGVIGYGGPGKDPSGADIQGTGVIGIGVGHHLFTPFNQAIGTGVLGAGVDGVIGHGSLGRGGIFQADNTAQVRLVP